MAETLKELQSEMDLIIIPRPDGENCWVCGPSDATPVGDDIFMLTGETTGGLADKDFKYHLFCAKHMGFTISLVLTHLLRVDKGKEEGPLKLPLIRAA